MAEQMWKVLENRAVLDEERMKKLEEELKEARTQAEEADKEQKTDSEHVYLETAPTWPWKSQHF